MSSEAEGRTAAEAFRREHHLGDQPLGDLVALIERSTGNDVAVLDVDGSDEHGLAMRDPKRDVVFIAVARTRHPMRQRSSLAHELAHVVFEDWGDVDQQDRPPRSPEEIRADAFARHLLVPQRGLNSFLADRAEVSEADLSAVVQFFQASASIAAIAMYECGAIDTSKKKQWMALTTPHLATRFGWSDQYESLAANSDRPRSPRRLLARATAGYEEGVVSAQAVATLRGITEGKATAELAQAGVFPQAPPVPVISADDLPEVDVDLSDLDEREHDHDDHHDDEVVEGSNT